MMHKFMYVNVITFLFSSSNELDNLEDRQDELYCIDKTHTWHGDLRKRVHLVEPHNLNKGWTFLFMIG